VRLLRIGVVDPDKNMVTISARPDELILEERVKWLLGLGAIGLTMRSLKADRR